MTLRLKALLSLRWNYTYKGVWFWLKGHRLVRCELCEGTGVACKDFQFDSPGRPEIITCPICEGSGKEKRERGYQCILSEPRAVIAEQEAAAEGVFV